MALPVLDGNQSATTLSSVVTGGEHIVAHSVVSLGTTAISNINSAVSGSAVTIPGLARLGNSIASDGTADANLDFIKIGGHQDGQNQVAHIVHVSAGGAMKVDASGSSVTFSQAPVTFGAITGSASILNFPSTQTIAGTVTANVVGWDGGNAEPLRIGGYSVGAGDTTRLALEVTGIDGNPLPISGTVTANFGSIASGVTIPVRLFAEAEGGPISGQDTLVLCDAGGQLLVNAKSGGASVLGYDGNAFVQVKQVSGSSVTIGSIPAISGTVTAAAPNGSLTTRFGTPTTANVSFATSAVTNANRKYLLIQNVTTGSNVITVGIGFTPTTTQGIQLTAGAGITFESSYIPTGAVYVLSSVTASNFTILEA